MALTQADFAPGRGTYQVSITINGAAIVGSPFPTTQSVLTAVDPVPDRKLFCPRPPWW